MSERVTSGERIQFYRDHAGEWRWRWIAANDSDQWADSGEGYGNKADMLEGAFHVRGERDIPIVDEDGVRLDELRGHLEEPPEGA